MPRSGEDLSLLQDNPMGPERMVHFECTSNKLWLGYDKERIQGSYRRREDHLIDSLQWLVQHQSQDGSWDADVATTGLAVLALRDRSMGKYSREHDKSLGRGLRWLRNAQQDTDLFAKEVGASTVYNQALATFAISRRANHATYRKMLPPLVNILAQAQGPQGAWSLELEPSDNCDPSTTGWAVSALLAAKDMGTLVDPAIFDRVESWFASQQDPETGRVSCAGQIPVEKSEALTAVALYARLHMAGTENLVRWSDHPNYAMLKKQAQLLAANPPVWNESSGTIDFYYWYYGTLALYRWGGEERATWMKALGEALIPHQRLGNEKDDCFGSWDPVGIRGEEGGRVYSTALCGMMLETYYLSTAVHVRQEMKPNR